jgi:hypothetical protein
MRRCSFSSSVLARFLGMSVSGGGGGDDGVTAGLSIPWGEVGLGSREFLTP